MQERYHTNYGHQLNNTILFLLKAEKSIYNNDKSRGSCPDTDIYQFNF